MSLGTIITTDKRFCIKCGKEIKDYKVSENYCDDCKKE